jgi:hypothetical protein
MKKIIIILLFINVSMFSQQSNFYVQNQKVYWEAAFKTSELDIIKVLSKNNKIIFDESKKTGRLVLKDCKCNFNEFTEQNLFMDFAIVIFDGKYKIRAERMYFKFDSENEYLTNSNYKQEIERSFLRRRREAFQEDSYTNDFRNCIDYLILKNFKIENSEKCEVF